MSLLSVLSLSLSLSRSLLGTGKERGKGREEKRDPGVDVALNLPTNPCDRLASYLHVAGFSFLWLLTSSQ